MLELSRVLFLGLRWPPVARSAAGARTLQVLEILRRQAHGPLSIIFSCPAPVTSPSAVDFNRAWLSELGRSRGDTLELIQTSQDDWRKDKRSGSLLTGLEAISFSKEANDPGPSLVFYDTLLAEEAFGWRVRTHWPQSAADDVHLDPSGGVVRRRHRYLEVLDTQDLHSLRLTRQVMVAKHVLLGSQRAGDASLLQAAQQSANRSGEVDPDAAFQPAAAVDTLRTANPRSNEMWSLEPNVLRSVEKALPGSFPDANPSESREVSAVAQNMETQATRLAGREIASMLRCDGSLIISPHEMGVLSKLGGAVQKRAHYLPFIVGSTDGNAAAGHTFGQPYADRRGMMTLGHFRHAGNCDSVLVTAKVWPEIRRRVAHKLQLLHAQGDAGNGTDVGASAGDAVECHAYGAYAGPQWAKAFRGGAGNGNALALDGFAVKGELDADDLQASSSPPTLSPGKALPPSQKRGSRTLSWALQNYRLMLAPLRFGAGLKGKLLDAAANGLPVITTRVGIEGWQESGMITGVTLDALTNGSAALARSESNSSACCVAVAGTDEEFVELAARAYTNEGGLWDMLHRNTKTAIETAAQQSRDVHRQAFKNALQKWWDDKHGDGSARTETAKSADALLSEHLRREATMNAAMKTRALRAERALYDAGMPTATLKDVKD